MISAFAPLHLWHETDGVITFSVTSDGTTGEEWIAYLEQNDLRVGDYAKHVLRSSDFKPTNSVTTQISVLKGSLFTNEDRITSKIRAEAKKRKLEMPNPEVACLIRKLLTDQEIAAMDLRCIVVMHESIYVSGVAPILLGVGRDDDGRWLCAYGGRPGYGWAREHSFAFVSPQVS